MASKSEQLEQLFMEWEYAQENESDFSWERTRGGKNITKSHFRRDGIIDEAVFSKEKRKVLFISNEANDDEYSAKSNPKPSNIDDKQIPIFRMWHTSYYQGKIEPLQGYSNKIIGKLCAKCREEMKRYNLI